MYKCKETEKKWSKNVEATVVSEEFVLQVDACWSSVSKQHHFGTDTTNDSLFNVCTVRESLYSVLIYCKKVFFFHKSAKEFKRMGKFLFSRGGHVNLIIWIY